MQIKKSISLERLQNCNNVMWLNARNCLVHGSSKFVDDADVGRPSDSEWHVEVDDAGCKSVGGHRCSGVAAIGKISTPTVGVHVRPNEHRDVERHVVDPYADDDGRSYCGFQCRSSHLLQSQKSRQQLWELNTADSISKHHLFYRFVLSSVYTMSAHGNSKTVHITKKSI